MMQKRYMRIFNFLNIALTMLFVLLVGCSTRTPVGPVHVSSKTYYCRGEWHHPQDYYEYDKVGMASWYGDDCHGKAKANCEKFNKNALTAAHRTLPIPSVVKVTSYITGKSIIVVVDDRGPFFYKGRIIDLSYAAAKELGIQHLKPTAVRVQTLVADSLRLSQYIAYNCKNMRDPHGRSWAELYFNEIKGYGPGVYIEKGLSKPKPTKSQQQKTKRAKAKKASSKRKGYNRLGSYLKKV